MQNFQQQYSRKVITGSFYDLQHIVYAVCTNKNNNIGIYLLQNRANIKELYEIS